MIDSHLKLILLNYHCDMEPLNKFIETPLLYDI